MKCYRNKLENNEIWNEWKNVINKNNKKQKMNEEWKWRIIVNK